MQSEKHSQTVRAFFLAPFISAPAEITPNINNLVS